MLSWQWNSQWLSCSNDSGHKKDGHHAFLLCSVSPGSESKNRKQAPFLSYWLICVALNSAFAFMVLCKYRKTKSIKIITFPFPNLISAHSKVNILEINFTQTCLYIHLGTFGLSVYILLRKTLMFCSNTHYCDSDCVAQGTIFVLIKCKFSEPFCFCEASLASWHRWLSGGTSCSPWQLPAVQHTTGSAPESSSALSKKQTSGIIVWL